MGFDIFVELRLKIDPFNGTFYAYGINGRETVKPEEYLIPKEHLRFVKGRGHIYHAYIQNIHETETDVEAPYFEKVFPSWADVQKYKVYEECKDDWTEDDHKNFFRAIQWFSSHPGFHVIWSY